MLPMESLIEDYLLFYVPLVPMERGWILLIFKVEGHYWLLAKNPCEQDWRNSIHEIIIKLSTNVEHGERMFPIDFQDQRSRSLLNIAKYPCKQDRRNSIHQRISMQTFYKSSKREWMFSIDFQGQRSLLSASISSEQDRRRSIHQIFYN